MVVVVDVRSNKGAIRIVAKKDNEYVDDIGTEETGKLVYPRCVSWEEVLSETCFDSPSHYLYSLCRNLIT